MKLFFFSMKMCKGKIWLPREENVIVLLKYSCRNKWKTIVMYSIKIDFKSERKHLQSVRHNEFEFCMRINQTIKNPEFFEMDSIFDKYIINHNKNFELYLDKYVFNLVFDNEYAPHAKSELQSAFENLQLYCFSLLWIEYFTERGQNFSHISEMNITTINPFINMIHEFYIRKPKSILEGTLCGKVDENPHLISALDRGLFHPLFREYSLIAFPSLNKNLFLFQIFSILSWLVIYFPFFVSTILFALSASSLYSSSRQSRCKIPTGRFFLDFQQSYL